MFLIVDEHPAHKAKKVKQFVEQHSDKLELYYLPGYSPELNPHKQVWNHVKNHTVGKMAIKGPAQLKMAVQSALRRLARMPHIVRGFFKTPELKYAVY